MKKKQSGFIITLVVIIGIVLLTKSIGVLPWWSFVVPVLLLGWVISKKQWRVAGFGTGFIAGFLIWFFGNLYFDSTLNGIVLGRIGLLIAMPKIVVLLLAGIMGGVLTGLALYAGKNLPARA